MELREQYALAFQTLASSTVSSWEVAAAELNRAAKGPHGAEAAGKLVERFSDALVPVLTPLQATERATQAIWKDSTRAASASGRIEDAVAPLVGQVRALGAEVASAWPKTTEYLEPLLVEIRIQTAGRERLAAVGPALQAALDSRGAEFCVVLGRLSQAKDLEGAFLDAVETYRHAAAQDLEVALDGVRSVLVEAARRDP
jgi:hypothetical protein